MTLPELELDHIPDPADGAELTRGPTYCDVTAGDRGAVYTPNGFCAWRDCGKRHDRRYQGRPQYCCSPEHKRLWVINHIWGEAVGAVQERDGACVRCALPDGGDHPEVNHIVPREGRGYAQGCWNHLDGLELLCHDCHLLVGAEQRAQAKARAQSGAQSEGRAA